MVFRTLSQSLTSKSSLLLDDDFDSPRRQRSNSTTKLKKNRRSGYTSIGEHEASDNFNDFDGDHCNKKDNKLIIMNQQNVQEPSARQSTKTGFPEPFCGDRNTTRPHPQAIIGANAVITAENIPKVRNTRHASFWRHKGKSTKHGKILESDYNISCDDSIADETAMMDEKNKRDSGVHISMDSSSRGSLAKSDQSIRSGSASSQDSTKSSSRKNRILNKFKF